MCIEQTRNGEAPKCCDLQGRSFDLLWEQMRSAAARLCSAMEKNGYATTGDGGAKKGVGDDLRGHAAELLGYALHCVGLAAKGRASAQKSAALKASA